jgi:hypothetical protein
MRKTMITTKSVSEPNSTSSPVAPEDFKDPTLKGNLSKFDYDLFKEEDDISEKVIRVKRMSMPNKGERWRIFEDNKVILNIEGTKLTNKEKEFLRTVEGVNFLIAQFKSGNIKSFNSLKKEIKKKVK